MSTSSKLIIKAATIIIIAIFSAQIADAQKAKNVFAIAAEPIKMNVLYIGIPNPLDIAVSGIKPENIDVSISGATNSTIRKDTTQIGRYIVNVRNRGEVILTISLVGKKKSQVLGTKTFRVKYVPDPYPVLNGKTGGEISKNSLANASVEVALNYDFEMKLFEISSFTLTAKVGDIFQEEESNSGTFNKSQRDLIEKIEPGSVIYIENIKAKGIDGSTRSLNTLKFTISEQF